MPSCPSEEDAPAGTNVPAVDVARTADSGACWRKPAGTATTDPAGIVTSIVGSATVVSGAARTRSVTVTSADPGSASAIPGTFGEPATVGVTTHERAGEAPEVAPVSLARPCTRLATTTPGELGRVRTSIALGPWVITG